MRKNLRDLNLYDMFSGVTEKTVRITCDDGDHDGVLTVNGITYTSPFDLNIPVSSYTRISLLSKAPKSCLVTVYKGEETSSELFYSGATRTVIDVDHIDFTLDSPPSAANDFTLNYGIITESDGVIKHLTTIFEGEITWDVDGLDAELIDNFAGYRKPNTNTIQIAKTIGTEVDGIPKMNSECFDVLATQIGKKFVSSWVKMYEALSAEYNPIENYSMSETRTPNLSRKNSVSADYSEADETKTNFKTESDGETYGFNSTVPVPASKNTAKGTETDNHGTTTHTQTGYREETQTGTETLIRSGNIGVTTSAQMIQGEMDIRAKYRIRDIMLNDIASYLSTMSFAPGIIRRI